jgi:hypothetical protein
MRTQFEIVETRLGNDGRFYLLAKTNDSWCVVSEGFSQHLNGWARFFEAEFDTEARAKEMWLEQSK